MPPTVNVFSHKSLCSITYRFDGLYSLGWSYPCLMSLSCRNLIQSSLIRPVTSVTTMCVVLPVKRKQACTKASSHTNILLKFSDFCMFWSWFEICFGSETCPDVMNLEVSENSWFTAYQERFSSVWPSKFQKSEACLISHLSTFWGEEKKMRKEMQSGNHDYVP